MTDSGRQTTLQPEHVSRPFNMKKLILLIFVLALATVSVLLAEIATPSPQRRVQPPMINWQERVLELRLSPGDELTRYLFSQVPVHLMI